MPAHSTPTVADVTAVIQARMGSTRLPGKVLRLLRGRPVLAHVVGRLRRASWVSRIVVATSDSQQDDPVERQAADLGVLVTRGSETDVLRRCMDAFREHGGDIGVRITGDCPLLDPTIVDAAVNTCLSGGSDYVSNTLDRTYPRGYDVEVFSVGALAVADTEAADSAEREHVTPFIYRRPNRFKCKQLTRHDLLGSASWRLTLDTEDDWRLIAAIVEALEPVAPNFGLADVERMLAAEPDLLAFNRHIEQKRV